MTHQLDPLTFPLHGSRLIEASAGTGKTYTIAALYLRLVLGHGDKNSYNRPLTPPEILVMTFTNAATQELRDRIRSRLTQAAAFFRDTTDGDPYLEALRNTFPVDQWLNGARVLDQAAQWMDEAAIYTIHSWSQRMLRQHAFESGSLFDLELEPDDQALLEEAACDYWRFYLYPLSPEPLVELIDLIKCSTPQELLGKVRPLLTAPSKPAADPFVTLEKRRQAIEEARQRWKSEFDGGVLQIRQAREEKILSGTKYPLASLEKWFGQLAGWTHDNGPLPDKAVRVKLSYSGLNASLNKNRSMPDHPAYPIFDQLNERLTDLKVNTALFNHAAQDIARRFHQEKQRRGQMGYDDLLTRLNDALQKERGGDRLARVISRQFPVALIDEFQDTDPIQYTALGKIYLHRTGLGLFMIGDPKQAIYAFRGADIHTYLNARHETAGNLYTLGKNYRSTHGMVQSVNRLFTAAAEHPQGAFMFEDDIPFDPVDVHGRSEHFEVKGKPVNGMHLWQLSQAAPVPKTGQKGYLVQMAETFATEIAGLLTLGQHQPPKAGFRDSDSGLTPLRPADVAVLVKNWREAKAIRSALDKRNVRSVYLSDKDSIFASAEAKEMLYLLRACSDPKRESILKTALATPILDLPLNRLDELNQDEIAWEAEVDRFCRYQRIWLQQGVLPMFRALLQEFGVSARLLSTPGGERSLTNVLHLAELLQSASGDLDGEQALLRWLTEMIHHPGGGSDEHILRLESDEDLIRVITVHKSKGLEYPLVFLPFVCTFRQITTRWSPVVTYHDKQGRLKLVQDPDNNDLKAADRERMAEDLRLLYVAVTRARFACWLGIGVMGSTSKTKGETSHLHRSGLGYLLSPENPISTDAVSDALARLKGDCQHISIDPLPEANDATYTPEQDVSTLSPALEFTSQVPSNWWIASYSAISAGAGKATASNPEHHIQTEPSDAAHSAVEDQLIEVGRELPSAVTSTAAALSIHHFPRGPQPGTFLHGLLEWAADEGFDKTADNRQLVYDRVQQVCKHRGWDDWADMLVSWFRHLLQSPLRLPEDQGKVALAQLMAGGYQPELEFLFAAHHVDTRVLDQAVTAEIAPGVARPQLEEISVNGMLKGFIDLAFCHQGRYYVLDYKSNYLGENGDAYGSDAMTEAMLEHRYDLQYVLYTLAMHRLLKSRLPGYDYQRDMGGAIYVFLRGVSANGRGVYVDKPPWPLIKRLDGYFSGKEEQ